MGLTAAITVPVIALGKKVLGLGVDFETSMTRLSIASKGAAADSGMAFVEWQKQMEAAALAVGGDTRLLGVSASGAAESMTGLYKAGLSTVEIFGDLQSYMAGTAELGGALKASIDLAAATTLDMVQASDLAATTLATFGGELKTDAERADFVTAAMDNLVKAADASSAEVDDLSQALTFVGSSAYDAKYSIEDTNNALAILSTRSLKGGRAGRNLQSMLASLQNPSDIAAEALAGLGIEIYDAEENLKKMPAIIAEFNKGLEGLTQKERDAALGAIFTNAGIRAALPLLEAGAKGWDEMAAATASATGIEEQAAAMTDTLAGQWEGLLGTLETLAITVSKHIIPPLTELVQTVLKPFIEKLLALNPNVILWGVVLAGVAAAAGPLLMVLGTLVTVIGTIGAPILLVIAAVGLLAAAFATNFMGVRDAVLNVWAALLPTFQAIWGWLQTNIPAALLFLKNWFVTTWSRVRETVARAIIGIAAHLVKLKPIFNEIKTAIQNWIAETWPKVKAAVVEAFAKVQAVIVHVTKTVLPWLVDAFGTVVDWIVTNWPQIKETIINVFETVQTAIEKLRGFWENTLLPALTAVWEFIRDHMIPYWQALADLFNAVMTKALTALAGLWQNVLLPAIQAVGKWINKNLRPIFEWLARYVGGKLTQAFGAIGGVIDKVTGWIRGLASAISNLTLPGWLTPGSPTPFELGLRGISDALKEVAGTRLPQLSTALEVLPDMGNMPRRMAIGLTTPPATSPMAGGRAGAGGGTTIQIIFQEPVFLHDDRMVDYLADRITRRLHLQGGYQMAYKGGTA